MPSHSFPPRPPHAPRHAPNPCTCTHIYICTCTCTCTSKATQPGPAPGRGTLVNTRGVRAPSMLGPIPASTSARRTPSSTAEGPPGCVHHHTCPWWASPRACPQHSGGSGGLVFTKVPRCPSPRSGTARHGTACESAPCHCHDDEDAAGMRRVYIFFPEERASFQASTIKIQYECGKNIYRHCPL